MREINFIKIRHIAFGTSIFAILVGLAFIFFINGFHLGIDFAGGQETLVSVDNTNITIKDVRSKLTSIGLEKNVSEVSPSRAIEEEKGKRFFMIKHKSKKADVDIIKKVLSTLGNVEILKSDAVSSAIAKEFWQKAIIASIVVIALILFYLAIRFEFMFGVAAVAALIHDILILLAIISIFQMEVNIPIVAAILTIIGYSLNDTIVIFDRIRENIQKVRREEFVMIVNKSINQSLSRTLITSLTTLFSVVALYIWGGSVLKDFSLALIVGVVSGTYSSIYIASPILIWLESILHKEIRGFSKKRAKA